ncbi:MAG: class I SAM-dependent methyltransferase [Candidatus Helarchaeota archaeon]
MKPINYYDTGDNTEERSFLFDRERKSMNYILKYLQSSDVKFINLLDVGCGDGFFLNSLSNEFKDNISLQGIDYSEFQLERAKKRSFDATFKRANLEDGIPYEDCSFDIIYSGEVIEHLYNPDGFVCEVYRILKNNGIFVISTPNINCWLSRLIFPLGVYPIFYETSTEDSTFGFGFLKPIKKQSLPVGHIRVMNVDAVKALLISNNFQIDEIQGYLFERYSGIMGILDKLFTVKPSLSSGIVICAKKIVGVS